MAEKDSVITEEMEEAAKASVKKVNAQRSAKGSSKIRRKGGASKDVLTESDIPFPEMDLEEYGPVAFGSSTEGLEITGQTDSQEFFLEEDKLQFLSFAPPGQNLPKKRLYTVKALHTDGRLIQLPSEPQIQNNAGGDPEDFIGLNRYLRKGIKLLVTDTATMQPLYCAAWGCWARAEHNNQFPGFCSMRHAEHTLPNRFRGADETLGAFGRNATTSRTWSM